MSPPTPDTAAALALPNEKRASREHYELELRLAERLRRAAPEQRRSLYGAVYDELYSELERLGLADSVQSNDPGQVALLLQLLAPFVTPVTVFADLGAGNGALCLAVAERVSRAYAIDASTHLELPPTPVPSGFVRLTPEEARHEIEAGSVDLAMSCHFVEHLHEDDLPEHLAEVKRMLRPGGCYVVVTPNVLLGPHDVSRGYHREARGLHLREYSTRTLSQALRHSAFATVEALCGVGRPPRLRPTAVVVAGEALLRLLPRSWRHRFLSRIGTSPLRPFEQVKLLATKR